MDSGIADSQTAVPASAGFRGAELCSPELKVTEK
jgi:hypothetical protein